MLGLFWHDHHARELIIDRLSHEKKTTLNGSLIVYFVKTDKLLCIDKQLSFREREKEVKTTGMLNKA